MFLFFFFNFCIFFFILSFLYFSEMLYDCCLALNPSSGLMMAFWSSYFIVILGICQICNIGTMWLDSASCQELKYLSDHLSPQMPDPTVSDTALGRKFTALFFLSWAMGLGVNLPIPVSGFPPPPALLRYDYHITLFKFKVSDVLI